MLDPSRPDLVLRQALDQVAPAPSEVESRVRQGRLSFAATISALRSGCACEACALLRQTVDMLLAEVKREANPNA